MQILKMLNREELQQFNRVKNSQYGLEEKTLELCLKYYVQYRGNMNTQISSDKIAVALRSALFMAEKSTHIVNMQGERISSPSLTLSGLLKSHPLDEVMITLKDLTKNVTINDKQASTQLNNLIKEISFLITYHKKFEKSIEKLQLKERNPQSAEYIKYWVFTAWLFYIEVRSKLLKKSLDVIENTCMLAHTLAFMLSFGWEHIVPMGILKVEKKINEHSSMKEVFGPFRQIIVFEMFSIKTDTIYTHLASKFEDYFQELISKKIIKTNQNYDFLSPDLLMANYRRLDKHYERQINGLNLDQRIFLKERTANLTPSKFTPFARQGYANKGKKVGGNNDVTIKQNYLSHRMLNYQMIDKQQNPIKPSSEGLTLARLPKAVLFSPSMTKVALICATPVSGGMQMMNYLNEKAKKFQDNFNQGYITKKPHEASVIKHIDLIFNKNKKDIDKKTKEIKEQIVYSFFKLALQDYLCQNPSEIDNETCYKALMGLSIQLFLFANNSSILFEDVEKDLKIQPFQLWKACDFFLKFDKGMPVSLKLHLLDLEVGIISYKVWKSFDFIEKINDFANNNLSSAHEFIQKFFKRLLHQMGFQIQQFGQNLKLQQKNLEHVYEIMKHILSESTDMLFMKHIDQLIICAVFAINKKEKLQIKFNEVISSYREINYHNSDLHEMIIHSIPLKEKEKPVNVINYYNDCFIKRMREYVMKLHQEPQIENKKNYSNNPILMSPLKDILPRDLNKKNMKNHKTDQCHKDLLISYNDSPLLKHQPLAFKGKEMKATGVINYDEESQIIKQNIQPEKHSPRNIVNNNHHVQISKKFSGQNNIPWKKPQLPSNNLNNPGITPPRSKNMIPQQLGVQLSNFSSNPTPNISQQNRINPNPIIAKTIISQYGMNGISKQIRSKYQ